MSDPALTLHQQTAVLALADELAAGGTPVVGETRLIRLLGSPAAAQNVATTEHLLDRATKLLAERRKRESNA